MKIIDCNCCIGFSSVNHVIVNHEKFTLTEKVKEVRNAEELIEEMDFCGIDSAVVYHQTMLDVSPEYGNRKISIEAGKYPDRLIASWTLLPSLTDEEFEAGRLFDGMRSNKVKFLRAYPDENRFFLNSETMGETITELIAGNVPLFLSPKSGWEYIYGILKEYPKLTVIINNYGPWSPDRYLYPLMKIYPNVYFETGDYQTDGAIEKICTKFGSERLLFGSEFPVNNIGGPLASLLGARITNEEKEKIAFGNVERLMKEVAL